MNETNFDSILNRPIANGSKYNNLIPKAPANKTFVGTGDTDYSVKEMAKMVKEYSFQMKQVANELQGVSFQQSIDNVKDFIYNNFQYKADLEDQLLRSPSYAWHIDRQNGIDCKSYSIIASCLFTEMGILHYIRKIKQPTFAPTEWTHVYVVVPADQKTGSLQNYYTVDGTLEDNYEPAYTEKSDLLMKLNHYALNAPANQYQSGLGISIASFKLDNAPFIKNLLFQISCKIEKSAYGASKFKATKEFTEKYFNELILKINTAVQDADDVSFSTHVNEFFGMTTLLLLAAIQSRKYDWSSSCTRGNLDANIAMFKFYQVNVGLALTTWLGDNFTIDASKPKTPIIYNNDKTNTLPLKFDGTQGTNPKVIFIQRTISYIPKLKTINAFELTPYFSEKAGTTSFDPLQFLEGLTTVANSFTPDNGNGGGGTNEPNNNGNEVDPNNPNSKTAGFGVFGWVLVLAGLGIAFTKMKDQPASKTTKK